jgi:hypothetical protein
MTNSTQSSTGETAQCQKFASGLKLDISSGVIVRHLARLVLLFPGTHALFLLVIFARASGVV